jgi:hypothetical protein
MQKRQKTFQWKKESVPYLELGEDIKLMLDELKKLYEEKAVLLAENKKLKREIELLKKNE